MAAPPQIELEHILINPLTGQEHRSTLTDPNEVIRLLKQIVQKTEDENKPWEKDPPIPKEQEPLIFPPLDVPLDSPPQPNLSFFSVHRGKKPLRVTRAPLALNRSHEMNDYIREIKVLQESVEKLSNNDFLEIQNTLKLILSRIDKLEEKI